ncbi:hypothetical protein WJX72_006983 [[Myrmecia] bisecta]|uniref:Methyltransferase domain-containing protein n=1 Tax=[Myrmecia] bisecta TaxID=41462 RepID=A0AAW1R7W2_9CHLO
MTAPEQQPVASCQTPKQHYEEVAAAYEQAFFYSSVEYRDWILQHVLHHFQLPAQNGADVKVVDLGGGTGNFSQALAEAALVDSVLCVDMFREMLGHAEKRACVKTLHLDAVAFSELPPSQMRYSHILLKELIHHIPADQQCHMYQGLRSQLQPGGVIVTVTRPQEVDYPLFEAAREVWRQNQPASSAVLAAMKHAGLDVEECSYVYTAELPLDTWCDMVRQRFWSTFTHFTDAQLEAGIQEIKAAHKCRQTVRFNDKLLFLVARKWD